MADDADIPEQPAREALDLVSAAEAQLDALGPVFDAPGVTEVIAYGVSVPHTDGKAGMVTLVVDGKFQPKAFAEWADAQLPVYARPVFVRIARTLETTGTFKYRKIDLVEDGFDPHRVDGPLYVRGGRNGYQKLTPAVHAQIESGDLRL